VVLARGALVQGTLASGAELAWVAAPARPQGAMPGAHPPGQQQHATVPTGSQLGLQGPPAAVATMAVGAGNETGALPAVEVAAADVAGALFGVDAAAMAAGAAAAMAAGLGMPGVGNDGLLRTSIFPAPPPPSASHRAAAHNLDLAAALVAARAT